MKKCLTICAVLFLLTGCTKNYKTVEDYAQDISKIKDNKPYTIDVKIDDGSKVSYAKSYNIGKKWYCDISEDGKNYDTGILIVGDYIVTFNKKTKKALKTFNTKKLGDAANFVNPAYSLINWDKNLNSKNEPVFLNNNANKNGYPCRLIKFNNIKEACISDKYGIAVYQKATKINKKTNQEKTFIYNVTNIDNTDISPSTFEMSMDYKLIDLDKFISKKYVITEKKGAAR